MKVQSSCALVNVIALLLFAGHVFATEGEYPTSWDVIFTPSEALPSNYSFGAQTSLLKANTTFPPSALPLPCDIIKHRDTPITLRDGTIIYADIFLPATAENTSEPLPAIISRSPYGKGTPNFPAEGVYEDWFSSFGSFEGADAAIFACRGYVSINVDNRGAGKSQGNIVYWGTVDAYDGYDIIEWTASQSWCNGKVATYGSSWLAMSQWFTAVLNPPHLAAIVPWNGHTDLYRDSLVWGGIPDTEFSADITKILYGQHGTERPDLMAQKYPLENDYWEDKRAFLENITIPAYVVADGVSILHTLGTVEGFRRISSRDKWLRFEDAQEWHDMYNPEHEHDVLQFLDYHVKGVKNGWNLTPRVRVGVIDAGKINQQWYYSDWPIPETNYQRYYLDAKTNSLIPPGEQANIKEPSSISYNATSGEANFTVTFTKDMQLTGYFSARLYVEAKGNDDMDLFLTTIKLDENNNELIPEPDCPYSILAGCIEAVGAVPPGAAGRLRVSLRKLDPSRSTSFLPVQRFNESQTLSAGEIVEVDIAMVPRAHFFHAGQKLRLRVTGYNREYNISTINKGEHIIHTGGRYSSYIQLPIIS
ncbi:hypothetical protein DTO169E5_2221 [Paecilomyces variotii]|nr:hypothetical protein DTO169E5_2221 [Paecilomyces variotii]